ncbi:choice-of-anchor I family protein [Haloarcula laminariae]|uniref:choice-of-anchor I family protein n=1 Tax=Haloarcula laminariae TaxID=2961577 RepID=UPI0021CA56B4|nr:choice-of-anchor I family protein [Halomicroarcula laminariae]
MSEDTETNRREFLGLLGGTAAVTAAGTVSGAELFSGRAASASQTGSGVSLSHLGRYSTGMYDEGAAEIPTYDPDTQRLFVVNGSVAGIDVLDVSDPANPTKEDTISVGMGGANNVSVHDGTLAAAVEAETTQDNGSVAFYDASDLTELGSVEVGPLPDMVTFADGGDYVLTANEGEPNDDYSRDPAGSVSVVDVSGGVDAATAQTASFTPFDGQEESLRDRGIRIYGPDASASEDLEPEYIATDGTTAYVTLQENNALAIVDIAAAEVSELKALGYKDFSAPENALDAIEDDSIDIATQPLYGMYQPDAIEAYSTGGETYLVAANEGDAREYAAMFETGVLKQVDGQWGLDATEDDGDNIDVEVDASGFADGVLESLAGLEVTTEYGDTDGDGVLEELHLFGARSFSVHDTDGNRVYESGDTLEQLVATEQPEQFNSDDDENGRDAESVASGPEPEGITVGSVGGTPHAFVGLEEVSAVTTFDVSDPQAPENVDYTNTRNFDVGPEDDIEEGSMAADAAGDLSPEGLAFVPAADSPIDDAMLAVSYEVSGTTSLYRVSAGQGSEGDSETGQSTPASTDEDAMAQAEDTPAGTPTGTGTSGGSGPGFGTIATLGGLSVGGWLADRRRDDTE